MLLSAKQRSGYLKAKSCLLHEAPSVYALSCAQRLVITSPTVSGINMKIHTRPSRMPPPSVIVSQLMHPHGITEKWALITNPTKSNH